MAAPLRSVRRLGANAQRALRRASARSWLREGRANWLWLRIGPDLDEQRPVVALGEHSPFALVDVLRLLEFAADDGRIAGVALRLHPGFGGWARALALRRAIDAARERGLCIVVWADALDVAGYLIASGADRVWLPESGDLALVGLRVDQVFVRDLLRKLDVHPEVVRIGSFKSAGEMLTRDAPSPEAREQYERWQDSVFDELVDGVARGRGLEPAAVRDAIDRGPYGAGAAVEAGLVDACLYADELDEHLPALLMGGESGPSREPHWIDAARYFATEVDDDGWQALRGEALAVAYVVATGSITRGMGTRGITDRRYGELFARLADERGVRAVVVRVDSPGGDATASDLLYRSVDRLRRSKPVVISMGDVAASGGYYLAAAADAVLAESTTLTGSIGVVGGKLDLSGLYERLGISRHSLERGARAGMHSEARGFTPDERNAVKNQMGALYELFLRRVAEGRSLDVATLEAVASGRVWAGRDAREHGLVDALGGPLEALAEARRRAGLRPDERVRVAMHPEHAGLRRWLAALAGGGFDERLRETHALR